MLGVDGDAFPSGQLLEVNAMAASMEAQLDSMVDHAFALHPFTHSGFCEQVDRALFQNACADSFLDILPAAIFDDDRFDSLQMEKVGEHQASRPCAYDSDLRAWRRWAPAFSDVAIRRLSKRRGLGLNRLNRSYGCLSRRLDENTGDHGGSRVRLVPNAARESQAEAKKAGVRKKRGILAHHSLSIVSVAILIIWTVLYSVSDLQSRWGAFFGNAIADWSGVVVTVVATKYLYERGSSESRKPPKSLQGSAWEKIQRSFADHVSVGYRSWLGLSSTRAPTQNRNGARWSATFSPSGLRFWAW